MKLNSSAEPVVLVPPAVVTVTWTVPLAFGESATIEPVELTFKLDAGAEPKLTVLPLVKFVPVIVTSVPPDSGPAFGLTSVTVGRRA